MKRSEMVELMNKTFKEGYRGRNYEQVMDILLQALEEAGMLPPTTKLEYVGINDNAWDKEDEN